MEKRDKQCWLNLTSPKIRKALSWFIELAYETKAERNVFFRRHRLQQCNKISQFSFDGGKTFSWRFLLEKQANPLIEEKHTNRRKTKEMCGKFSFFVFAFCEQQSIFLILSFVAFLSSIKRDEWRGKVWHVFLSNFPGGRRRKIFLLAANWQYCVVHVAKEYFGWWNMIIDLGGKLIIKVVTNFGVETSIGGRD